MAAADVLLFGFVASVSPNAAHKMDAALGLGLGAYADEVRLTIKCRGPMLTMLEGEDVALLALPTVSVGVEDRELHDELAELARNTQKAEADEDALLSFSASTRCSEGCGTILKVASSDSHDGGA